MAKSLSRSLARALSLALSRALSLARARTYDLSAHAPRMREKSPIFSRSLS